MKVTHLRIMGLGYLNTIVMNLGSGLSALFPFYVSFRYVIISVGHGKVIYMGSLQFFGWPNFNERKSRFYCFLIIKVPQFAYEGLQ